MNVNVYAVIFLKEHVCKFGYKKEGFSGDDGNDSVRRKTSKTARS